MYSFAKHHEYACVYDWKIEHVEAIALVRRRWRWSAEAKAVIVQETFAPGIPVFLVARRHGSAPNQQQHLSDSVQAITIQPQQECVSTRKASRPRRISAIDQRLDASRAQFAGRPLVDAFPYLQLGNSLSPRKRGSAKPARLSATAATAFTGSKDRYGKGSELARQEISRRKPVLKNRTAPEIEQAVVERAIAQPAWG